MGQENDAHTAATQLPLQRITPSQRSLERDEIGGYHGIVVAHALKMLPRTANHQRLLLALTGWAHAGLFRASPGYRSARSINGGTTGRVEQGFEVARN